ncbi:MAG: dual specificity protein phosphatase family protein [Anaerolineae bacterium]|nr:dual specificity protein phosphatase family protein [Anaerolineae bacterium]
MTRSNPDSPLVSAALGIARLPKKLLKLGLPGAWDWVMRHTRRIFLGAPNFKRARITEQLYVGDQFSARGWRRLQREGITVVVNMREESDDRRLGVDIPVYCWLPTTDRHAPSMEHLREGVRVITEASARGAKVYIHCRSGEGRAPTMAAAYLISTGMAVEDALAKIKAVRSFIDVTGPQLARLREFEALSQE